MLYFCVQACCEVNTTQRQVKVVGGSWYWQEKKHLNSVRATRRWIEMCCLCSECHMVSSNLRTLHFTNVCPVVLVILVILCTLKKKHPVYTINVFFVGMQTQKKKNCWCGNLNGLWKKCLLPDRREMFPVYTFVIILLMKTAVNRHFSVQSVHSILTWWGN